MPAGDARDYEAEPILVLTRREGASFVLDLTCDRLALHVPAAPSTTCVITCVPYAVTCERLSTTQQECHCVDLYHTCETPCGSTAAIRKASM